MPYWNVYSLRKINIHTCLYINTCYKFMLYSFWDQKLFLLPICHTVFVLKVTLGASMTCLIHIYFVCLTEIQQRFVKKRSTQFQYARLPLRFTWILSSSGMLRSVGWFRTDVSWFRFGHIFKEQDVQEEELCVYAWLQILCIYLVLINS